jgi:hypothetical protein
MMPVTKKVHRTSFWRRVSRISGRGEMSEPASKVRAIHGRAGSPRAISSAVVEGGGAGARVALGMGVSTVARGVSLLDGSGLAKVVSVAVDDAVGPCEDRGSRVGWGTPVGVAGGKGEGVEVAGKS